MGKKITKPMIQKWESEFLPLPAPRNLFQGACPDGVLVPRNVLMFSREDSRSLPQGARDSFQHRRFVCIFNAGTAGSVAVDGSWIRLHPGHALLIFPYQVHTYGRLEQRRLHWIFLTFEAEVSMAWEALRQRAVVATRTTWDLLSSATTAWRRNRERSPHLPYWASLILLELQRAGRDMKTAPRTPRGHLLPRVHAWVHRPTGPMWSIKELARILGISEPHLRASFRAEVGFSLGTYLRRVRMARAASLLAGTDRSVGEIAQLCGYSSLYSFSRSFRDAMELSPRTYRMQAPRHRLKQA
jgi:AraC family transcriptional regulator of arabinose operon